MSAVMRVSNLENGGTIKIAEVKNLSTNLTSDIGIGVSDEREKDKISDNH